MSHDFVPVVNVKNIYFALMFPIKGTIHHSDNWQDVLIINKCQS